MKYESYFCHITLKQIQQRELFSDTRAVHILAMLIGAGADTTGTILQGFFKIMALHQDAVREVQEGEEKEKLSLVLFEISNSSSASDGSTC